MSQSQVQSIGIEIAILGQNGLDINEPEQKVSLRSLPGKFSGLHLCSIMYAAFKQFAPNENAGIVGCRAAVDALLVSLLAFA